MSFISRILAVLALAGAAAGCKTVVAEAPALGLASDGACVYRTVSIYDRERGYEVPVMQRFCGGRLQIAR